MKHDPITSTIESVPFADLYISDLNPRTALSEDGIAPLAANIAKLGLIQNLAGLRDEGGTIGIVAGGRRLRALALLQDDPRFHTVAVRIAPDAETAQQWASSENSQREALHPADEIRDYASMAARNVPVGEIAVAYGVTEKHVYRRLALGGLEPEILDALRAGTITLGQASAFTLSNDRAVSLDVLAQIEDSTYVITEHRIKALLKPDAVSADDRRAIFVGEDAYKAAGGTVTGDLFADDTLFNDPDTLDAVFMEKLDAEADRLAKEQGWLWGKAEQDEWASYDYYEKTRFARVYPVEGALDEEQAERYDALAELWENDALDEDGQAAFNTLQDILDGDFTPEQKAVAGIVVRVRRDGTLSVTEGLVRKEDQQAAQDAGVIQPSQHSPKAAKSPISQALRSDLNTVQTGARQNALLDHPDLALQLLAFQLSGKMGHSRAYGIRSEDVANLPGTETGYALDTRLTQAEDDTAESPWNRDHVAAFKTFKKRGHKRIMDLLHRYLVSQFCVQDAAFGAFIDAAIARNTRSVWTPTAENFFKRVGGPYMLDLWCDLLDVTPDHPTATTFAKLKKAEKAAKLESLFADPDTRAAHGLTDAQGARIDAWLPEDMI